MKKVKDLLAAWESIPATQLTVREYTMRLPIRDAARLEALKEMYLGVGISTIMTDLISASLDELESAMPYMQANASSKKTNLAIRYSRTKDLPRVSTSSPAPAPQICAPSRLAPLAAKTVGNKAYLAHPTTQSTA